MNDASCPAGLIIVSHGSPRAEVNRRFVAMVERIAGAAGHGTRLARVLFDRAAEHSSTAWPSWPRWACGGSCSCPIFSTRAST